MSQMQQPLYISDDELVLRFRDNKSIHVTMRENGQYITKIVSLDTLLDCVKNSLSGIRFSTGLLPSNIISISVDAENRSRYVVVEYAHPTADIVYMKTEYKDFPLPRLLFGFTVENSGRLSDVQLGVPAQGKLTPNTPMYYYPFSNVSRFRMCTGSNALPTIPTLQALQNLPSYILSLPDNDDMYHENHNQLSLGHRDLLEHLQDKDQAYYYDKVLIPMPNVTLKNFIERRD